MLDVNLAAWVERFPLDLFLPMCSMLDSIQTPMDWAIIEQIRERAAQLGDLGASRQSDSLVFIKGESPARWATKIGGAPYRPKSAPWPLREDGRPMTFVAQFSFVDSRDIVRELPGDVLLIFTLDDDLYLGDPPCLHFEWQPAGLLNLIEPDDVPRPAWVFTRGYAIRHRTVDFTDVSVVAKHAGAVCSSARRMHRGRVPEMLRSIARLPSAKIGGLPHWKYPNQHPGVEQDGPVLCALGDVSPGTDIDPPSPEVDWWADTDESWDDNPEDYLIWRDGCQINFFLKDDGGIRWSVDFG